jgi:ribonucleoside-diphosphate reductase subunit M1
MELDNELLVLGHNTRDAKAWRSSFTTGKDAKPAYITQNVIKGVYSGVTTVQLDTLAAETAAYLTTEHPDYSVLAARIAVSNLHKMTQKSFSAVMSDCYHCVDESSGRKAPLLADDAYQVIVQTKEELDSAIIYDRSRGPQPVPE